MSWCGILDLGVTVSASSANDATIARSPANLARSWGDFYNSSSNKGYLFVSIKRIEHIKGNFIFYVHNVHNFVPMSTSNSLIFAMAS